jgi:hypothetical protein
VRNWVILALVTLWTMLLSAPAFGFKPVGHDAIERAAYADLAALAETTAVVDGAVVKVVLRRAGGHLLPNRGEASRPDAGDSCRSRG